MTNSDKCVIISNSITITLATLITERRSYLHLVQQFRTTAANLFHSVSVVLSHSIQSLSSNNNNYQRFCRTPLIRNET